MDIRDTLRRIVMDASDEYDREDIPEDGLDLADHIVNGVINSGLVRERSLDVNPPAGWFTFGTYADTGLSVEFYGAEYSEDGLPIWERPLKENEEMDDKTYHDVANWTNTMTDMVYNVNYANGWFADGRTVGDDIALLHSEVSEMLEAYRDAGFADQTQKPGDSGALPKPEGFGSEAADVLIRLLDTCQRYDVDLAFEFARKLEYNATRGNRHGGKLL